MEEVVELTIGKYNGSLKAEHGTGRNMAPFVEKEWGSEIYNTMLEIKRLADPDNLLNVGIIFNDNKKVHIENLKSIPAVNKNIDLCVECGFCESVCPSTKFTFTPRQRIAVSRELELLDNNSLSKQLTNDYYFHSDLTCAVDGLCELACPIDINTGDFVKDLRKEKNGWLRNKISVWISNNFKIFAYFIRLLIKIMELLIRVFGRNFVEKIFYALNSVSSRRVPAWDSRISSSKCPDISNVNTEKKKYIYYPSCITRTFGADSKGISLQQLMLEIANIWEIELKIPDDINSTCCGTPFSSKGYMEGDKYIFAKTINILFEECDSGEIPIIVDTSPCTYKFLHQGENIPIDVKSKIRKDAIYRYRAFFT